MIGRGRRHRRADRRLLAAARKLVDDGLVVGTVGNLSIRRGDRVLITPTALPYHEMSPTDLVTTGLSGRHLAGRRAPSRELPLHLSIYRSRPDVAAIVHCHSPWATAWSFLGEPLAPATEEMAYYRIGPVRTCAPGAVGSIGLAEAASAALGGSRAALLHSHGTVAVGATVEEAATIACALEHQAHVAWLVRLGRPDVALATPSKAGSRS